MIRRPAQSATPVDQRVVLNRTSQAPEPYMVTEAPGTFPSPVGRTTKRLVTWATRQASPRGSLRPILAFLALRDTRGGLPCYSCVGNLGLNLEILI